jgi:hypothetical protein
VAGSCERGDESLGSGATELVNCNSWNLSLNEYFYHK